MSWRDVILKHEDDLCECGHLWLFHKTERGRRRSRCEHYGCVDGPRRDRCRSFRDTGLVLERDIDLLEILPGGRLVRRATT